MLTKFTNKLFGNLGPQFIFWNEIYLSFHIASFILFFFSVFIDSQLWYILSILAIIISKILLYRHINNKPKIYKERPEVQFYDDNT